jgi:hypothetical protein
MRLQVIWHATKAKNNPFWTALTLEDEARFLRNVRNDSPDDTVAHKAVKSRKLYATTVWKALWTDKNQS